MDEAESRDKGPEYYEGHAVAIARLSRVAQEYVVSHARATADISGQEHLPLHTREALVDSLIGMCVETMHYMIAFQPEAWETVINGFSEREDLEKREG